MGKKKTKTDVRPARAPIVLLYSRHYAFPYYEVCICIMWNIIYKHIARWFVCRRRRHCETRGQEKPVHLLVYEPRGVRVYIYIYITCVCRYSCICVYMRLYCVGTIPQPRGMRSIHRRRVRPTRLLSAYRVYIITNTHAYNIIYIYVYYMKI